MKQAWRFLRQWKREYTPDAFRRRGYTFAMALSLAWECAKLAAKVAAMA